MRHVFTEHSTTYIYKLERHACTHSIPLNAVPLGGARLMGLSPCCKSTLMPLKKSGQCPPHSHASQMQRWHSPYSCPPTQPLHDITASMGFLWVTGFSFFHCVASPFHSFVTTSTSNTNLKLPETS